MKLSIGMMVKNEEKYLEKCLVSIKPLLKEIDSELIIVDTGSTDETIDIARKFTDKVYIHKWNNNFSEMRNKVLEYCSGEWFFYIDGDEVMEKCDEIINFIKNGEEIKKYNTANINIKNLTDLENNQKYAMFSTARLFKLEKDFKFIGAIHNQPTWKEPVKYLNNSAFHYGYISNDEELMEKKFRRTSSILMRELKKDPNNIYYMYQLSVSYAMHKEYYNAEECIKKAYNYVKRKKISILDNLYILPQMCLCAFNLGKYDELNKYSNECLKYDDKHIDSYYYKGYSALKLNKYNEANFALKKYVNLVKEYEECTKRNLTVYYTIGYLDNVYFMLFNINNKLNLNEVAFEWIQKVEDMDVDQTIIEFCIKNEMYKNMKEYLIKSSNSDKIQMYIENELLKDDITDRDRLNISKEFQYLEGKYGLLNRIRFKYLSKDSKLFESIIEFYEKFKFETLKNYYGDILYYCIKYRFDIDDLFKNTSIKTIDNYLNYIIVKHRKWYDIFYQYIIYDHKKRNCTTIRINKELCRYAILMGTFNEFKFQDILGCYIENGITYMKLIYNEIIFDDERIHDVKNDEEGFFIYINKAMKYEKSSELEYIRYLEKALNIDKYMKDVIKFVINKKISRILEMKKYQKKVKLMIESFIRSGDLYKAESLISEYENITRYDIEMYSIKSVILIMKNRYIDAENVLLEGLSIDNNDFELLYNLAFIYESENKIELAFEFYKKALNNCLEINLQQVIKDKIYKLKTILIENENIDNTINLIKIDSKKDIINYLENAIEANEYNTVEEIFKFYLSKFSLSIGEIYYFLACFYNKNKMFEKSKEYHEIAIKVDDKLSNIVEKDAIKYNLKFNEEKVNCIGCECDDYEIVNVSNQSISETNKAMINPIRIWVKCKKCGLVYANPIPIQDDINKYYSLIAPEKFNGIYGDIKEKEVFLLKMSEKRLNNIKKLTNKKNLLDIGTGIGIFIKVALEKGFDAKGLELTLEDCKYAKENYNLDLIKRDFYSFKDYEKYDIVTMFEVIEHMRFPLKDLCRINNILNMNGIFVLATPILDSEYAKNEKEKNVFWNVVGHLSYFTKKVLTNYLTIAGFEIIKILESNEGMGRMEFYCRKLKEI